jgi:hypothetical protein
MVYVMLLFNQFLNLSIHIFMLNHYFDCTSEGVIPKYFLNDLLK